MFTNATGLAVGLIHAPLDGAQTIGSIVSSGAQVVQSPDRLADIVQLAAGQYHSVGLKYDGSIVAWGGNSYQQCIAPEVNSDFVAVAAGGNQSLGLRSNGLIEIWGQGAGGRW